MQVRNSFSFPTKVFAHRGCGTLWPENTLSAIALGKSLYNFEACEFDVMLSKDSVPFLMHDDVLDRTVGNTPFKGLSFNEVASSDLEKIDVGSWFDSTKSEKLKEITIPLFEEVLKYCINTNIYMNIEIKPVPGYEVTTGEVVASLTAQYFPSSSSEIFPLFSSFSFETLLAAKRVAPHIPRGYLISNINNQPPWKEQMIELDAVSVHTNYNNLNNEIIKQVKESGYKLFCYTVNDPSMAKQLIDSGVDAFCTDRVDIFSNLIF